MNRLTRFLLLTVLLFGLSGFAAQAACPVSANNAAITAPSTSCLTDAAGNYWGVPAKNGMVFLNGSALINTSNAVKLGYAGGKIWYQNNANPAQWFSFSTTTPYTTNNVTISAPTTTSPLLTPVPAPLASATTGSWVVSQQFTASGNGPGGKPLQYNYLLPSGYDPTKFTYPVMFVGAGNGQGMAGGNDGCGTPGTYPRCGNIFIGGMESDNFKFNTVPFRMAHPAIVVAPQCDQTLDGSGATFNSNCGGYADAANTSWAEQSTNALLAGMLNGTVKDSSNRAFSITPGEHYGVGLSLSAIGYLAQMTDNNSVEPRGSGLWDAGVGMSTQHTRSGESNSSIYSRMVTVPYMEICSPGDNACNWGGGSSGLWNYVAGQSTLNKRPDGTTITANSFPTQTSYDSGGMAAIRAGNSQFYYINSYNGGTAYGQFGCMNADGCDGTNIYAWLFSITGKSSGSTGTSTPPPTCTETADQTAITTVGPSITDASCNVWTLTSSNQVAENGSTIAGTANVVELAYANHVVWQENTSSNWYSFVPAGGPTTVCPLIACGAVESIIVSTIPTVAPNTAFTVSGTIQNVTAAPALQYLDNGGTTWVDFPTTASITTSTFSFSHPGMAANASATVAVRDKAHPLIFATGPPFLVGTAPAPTGSFTVSGGYVIDPTGAKFVIAGSGIYDANASNSISVNSILQDSSGHPYKTVFPNGNYIRVMVFPTNINTTSFTFHDPSVYDDIASKCESAKIVCEFEDHSSNGSTWEPGTPGGLAGSNSYPPTGAMLTSNLTFWKAMATRYKNNKYVWLGSLNELNGFSSSGLAGISTYELAFYNAIRGTGFTNIIDLQGGAMTDGTLGPQSGLDVTAYAGMTNIIFFDHYYLGGPVASAQAEILGSTTNGTKNGLPGCYGVLCQQQIKSKDGVVPMNINEFGDCFSGSGCNISGSSNTGQAIATAMTNLAASNGVGGAAFVYFDPNGVDSFNQVNNGGSISTNQSTFTLTTWGNIVKGWMDANPFPGGNGPGVGGPPAETLSVTANSPVPQNTTFTVAGTIQNVTAAPTLQYSDNGSGSWITMPAGAVVTTTGFSFSHPGMASNPTATVSVRDANNPAISATGPPFVVTGQASSNCTIIAPGSGTFTDGTNVFSITSALISQENGVNIPGGSGTGAGEWYNGLAYFQDNTSKSWFTWNGSIFNATTAPGSCAAIESLSINTIAAQTANVPFSISGAIVGLTAAPALQFQDNGGVWQDFPAGSTVTNLNYSFTHPGLTAGASNTINIRDKVNTNVTKASNSFAVNAGSESANKTVITTTAQNLTDATGKTWTFDSSCQVVIGGVADASTSSVTQMAYVNHVVWYENASGKWFYNSTGVAGNWQPPGGNSNSPLNIIESQDRAIVSTIGPLISDQFGNTFVLTAGNKISVNGAAPSLTNIIEIVYVNHTVWVEDSNSAWSRYTNGAWSAPTSISPLTVESIIVNTISDQATGVGFPVSGTVANVTATPSLQFQANAGAWTAFPPGSIVTLNGPSAPIFSDFFTTLNDISDTGGPATGPVVTITPTPSGQSFVDTTGNTWTINSSQAFKNGNAAGASAAIAQLMLVKTAVWYLDTGGNWFAWSGTAWTQGMNPLLGGATGAWRNGYSFGGSEYTLSFNTELEYYSSGTRPPNWSPFSLQNGGAGPGLIITVDTTPQANFLTGHTPANPLSLPYNSGLINSSVEIPSPLLNNGTPAPGLLTYQYGYLEFEALLPGGPGMWVSVTDYPLTGSGEIDLLETGGSDLTHVHGTVHSSTTNVTQPIAVTDYTQNRHVYGVDWQADHITWYVDHVQQMQIVTPTDMIGKPYYFTLGLAIQGSPTQGFDGVPTAASVFPAQMFVDWVKLWPNFAASQALLAGSTAFWNFTAPAMSANPTNTISVRDAANTNIIGSSNGFAVLNKEALTINAIAPQTANVAFTVGGTIVNTTVAPTLQYQNNGGPFLPLPAGSSVTATAFSFTNPGLPKGLSTISVRDAITTTIVATATISINAAPINQGWNPTDTSATITLSNNSNTATSTATQQGGSRGVISHTTGKFCFDETLDTVTPNEVVGLSNASFVLAGTNSVISITATPTGQVLTDASGHKWTIVNGATLEDGVSPAFSSNVVQVSLVNGNVYQKNSSNQWYQWTGSAWNGINFDPTVGGGTPTPLGLTGNGIGFNPSSATVPQSIYYNGVQVLASAAANEITPTSGGSLTDSAGNKWTMSGAAILLNGVAIPGGNGTKAFAIVNGNTYYAQDANTGAWFTYSLTTQQFTPASAPMLTNPAKPDVSGDPVTICVDLDAHTEWVSTPTMRQTLGQTWNLALLTAVDPSKGTGGVSFNGLLCPCYPTMTTPDNATAITLNVAGPLSIVLPTGFSVWQPAATIIHHPFVINLGMIDPANDNFPDDLIGLRREFQ